MLKALERDENLFAALKEDRFEPPPPIENPWVRGAEDLTVSGGVPPPTELDETEREAFEKDVNPWEPLRFSVDGRTLEIVAGHFDTIGVIIDTLTHKYPDMLGCELRFEGKTLDKDKTPADYSHEFGKEIWNNMTVHKKPDESTSERFERLKREKDEKYGSMTPEEKTEFDKDFTDTRKKWCEEQYVKAEAGELDVSSMQELLKEFMKVRYDSLVLQQRNKLREELIPAAWKAAWKKGEPIWDAEFDKAKKGLVNTTAVNETALKIKADEHAAASIEYVHPDPIIEEAIDQYRRTVFLKLYLKFQELWFAYEGMCEIRNLENPREIYIHNRYKGFYRKAWKSIQKTFTSSTPDRAGRQSAIGIMRAATFEDESLEKKYVDKLDKAIERMQTIFESEPSKQKREPLLSADMFGLEMDEAVDEEEDDKKYTFHRILDFSAKVKSMIKELIDLAGNAYVEFSFPYSTNPDYSKK